MLQRLGIALLASSCIGLVAGCAGTTADSDGDQSSASKESTIPAPSPGTNKADSTTRRTEIRGSLAFDQPVEDRYTDDSRYVGYTFETTDRAWIDLEVTSDEVDPAVWVYGPRDEDGDWGYKIAENDDIDWPDNENAALSDVTLEEAGTYMVVTGTHDWEGGPFRLAADCSGSGCPEADGSNGGGSDDDGDVTPTCDEEMTVAREVGVGQAGSYVEGSQSGKDIEVVGDVAYMANMQRGICRFDVSEPLGAELLGCMRPPSDGSISTHRVHDIEVDGDTMYVLNSLKGLWVYDISEPENPSVVDHFADADYYGLEMTRAGDYLYLAARKSGTHILDVSDPTNPTRAGHLEDNGEPEGGAEGSYETYDIAVDGDLGYFAQRKGGLGVYDLSDPTEPRELGRYRAERAEGAEHRPSVMAVEVEADRAFLAVANDTSNLHIVDATEPETPQLAWTDDASPDTRYWVQETIHVSDDYVALARGRTRGIEVFERTGDGEASHLGTIEPAGEPSDVHVTDGGSLLYAAAANTLRNPGSHLMGLGVAPISCD
jgi:hypothetical protein